MPVSYLPPREARFDQHRIVWRTAEPYVPRSLVGIDQKFPPSSVSPSRTLNIFERFKEQISLLQGLEVLGAGLHDSGAPLPTQESINLAVKILRSLQFTQLLPERVQASAEGGVALTYVGSEKNRAMIEVLNEGEQYVSMYDTDGNVEVLDWSVENPQLLIAKLDAHLGGKSLAAEAI